MAESQAVSPVGLPRPSLRVTVRVLRNSSGFFFFFNDTATTEIYTLSLHDALPISSPTWWWVSAPDSLASSSWWVNRSEEHTSELQSRSDLVCRLLLEKKNNGPTAAPCWSADGRSSSPSYSALTRMWRDRPRRGFIL